MKTQFSIFTGILCFLIGLFLLPTASFAHVLKSDGSIGAVIHIDPEDDPIAGQESIFYFDFKDTQNKFMLSECDCIFSVMQGGEEIFSQPLAQEDTTSNKINGNYTFPERDIYQIKVSGEPKTSGAFEPFVLTYDMRVERVTDQQTTKNESESSLLSWITSHIVQLISGIVVLGSGVWFFSKKRVQ